MKDFNDFRNLINDDFFIDLANDINALNLQVTLKSLKISKEDLNEIIMKQLSINTLVTLELLEKYHEWISAHE